MEKVEGVAIILGVVLFLWSTAVIATGSAMLITDGRLNRREWYQFAASIVICVGLLAGYWWFGGFETPPPLPTSGTTPPGP